MRALLASIVVALLSSASSAFAQDHACEALAIDADEDFAQRIRTATGERTDIDTCARVTITERGTGILVAVQLPDGRSTSRMLSRREDVLPTVEALLLVPPELPAARAPVAEEPREATVEAAPAPVQPQEVARPPSAPLTSDPPERNRDRTSPAQAPNRLRIELSLLTGARIAEAQSIVGIGALSFIDANAWLIGFAGRADYIEGKSAGPPGNALSLNILLGRRFRFGWLSLDVYGGPGAARGSSSDVEMVTTGSTPPRRIEPVTPGTALRGLVGARISLRAESTFRLFAGLDADFGTRGDSEGDVARVSESGTVQSVQSEQLPAFSLGLNLGATVGTL